MKIEGVLYKFIVKGRRSLDKWDGLYKQGTHLIYGWVKLDTLGTEFPEWSWAYEWEGEDINPKTGKLVGHKLGKGWAKRPIWRDYTGGIKQWIEDLAAHRVFPRHIDPLIDVFPQALPVERPAAHVEAWKEQVIEQEMQVEASVAAVAKGLTTLNQSFPQYTHSCQQYGSGCPFVPVCWEGMKPEPGEIYKIREANHPERDGDE